MDSSDPGQPSPDAGHGSPPGPRDEPPPPLGGHSPDASTTDAQPTGDRAASRRAEATIRDPREPARTVDANDNRCLACGNGRLLPSEREASAVETGERFALALCTHCGTWETLPRLSDDEIRGYYELGYYGSTEKRFHPVLEAFWRYCQRDRARRVQRHVPSGKILDVGCGNGLFLANLDASRWVRKGTEWSEEAARAARARQVDVLVGDPETLPLPADIFDVITMWHVLEHVRAPEATLRKTRDLLRQGGLFVVAVPNMASWQAWLGGSKWYHLDVPRHYHHFTTRSLTSILEQHQFRVERILHFSPEYNWPGCVQTVYNAVGFPRNFLYGAARNTFSKAKAQPVPRRREKGLLLLAILLAPLVGAFSAALVLSEAVARRGGTVEIYARKA